MKNARATLWRRTSPPERVVDETGLPPPNLPRKTSAVARLVALSSSRTACQSMEKGWAGRLPIHSLGYYPRLLERGYGTRALLQGLHMPYKLKAK
jgi:hypothetical protein